MNPHDKLRAWKRAEAYDRVHDCRTLLYLFGFLSRSENQRVRKRIQKWLVKKTPVVKKASEQ